MHFRPTLFLFLALPTFLFLNAQLKSVDGDTIQSKDLDTFLKNEMQSLDIPGLAFALINDGEVVYTQTYGVQNKETQARITPKTIFEAASVSKSVFAYFVMLMVEHGKIALDAPLFKYVSEPLIEDERYKQITARMVLAHTAGLPNWRFLNADGKLDIKFEPGTGFRYSGEGYEYLAKALAYIHKTDYDGLDSIIKRTIYEPLKMYDSGFRLVDEKLKADKAIGYEDGKPSNGIPADLAKPYFGASFKFHTTVDDFARWVVALLQSKQMKQNTLEEMWSEQVVLPENETLRTENGFDSWGLGFMRVETEQGLKIAHGGMNPSFQSYFMVIPEKKFGFTIFGNSNTTIEMVPILEKFLGIGNLK